VKVVNPEQKGGETVKTNGSPTIRDYLQAGYPCLFLPTVECVAAEKKVRDAMEELDIVLSADYAVWKVTSGLSVGRADQLGEMREKVQEDLIDALAHVEMSTRPIVAIFHNVRQYIGHSDVIQQMIDTLMAVRVKSSHVILVGAHLELPPELKNLVTYCDCPLPSVTAIKDEFNKIATAYKDDINLPSVRDEYDALLHEAATAAVGLDMIGAENAFALSLALREKVSVRVIQAQKEQEVRKSDVLEFINTSEGMDAVGGFMDFKSWMIRRRKAFSDEAREYGLPYPRGVLLVGVAGSGKSLAAKAVAHFLRIPCLRLDMGKVFRSLVGESEAAMRMALQVAEAVSPVVLWLDEINMGLAGMRGSGELDSGVTSRVVSTVLTWRQETDRPVMLVATANDVATLPSMVYRKGRLDEVWATDLPTEEIRQDIFSIHLSKRGRDPKLFNIPLLARKTPGHVGAEIEGCIEDAMFSAFDEGKEVSTKYILTAISDTIPQSTRDAESIKNIREWMSTRARLVDGGEPTEKLGQVRMIKTKKKGVSKNDKKTKDNS